MDLAWTIAVGLVLGAWFGASVIHQFAPRWWRPVNKVDAFRLLPQWHFFAPRPGRRDHHLVVRDVVGAAPTAWRQIEVGCSPAGVRWLFNPYRYRQKALTDLINMLLTTRRLLAEHETPRLGELLSIPYLALLSWVLAQPGHPPDARQFAVIATTGHGHGSARDVRIVYVSRTHTLEQADGR